MKSTQTKTKASEPASKSGPFFNKDAGQGFFQPIQTKLTVNDAHDPLEKEADHVADQVVQKMDKGSVGRKPIFDSKNDMAEQGVQRKPAPGGVAGKAGAGGGGSTASGGGSVPASVQHNLAASKGGGAPLPEGTRREMEQTIGSDLSGVRVHNDGKAGKMSKDLGAQAFAHGKDIYFDKGKYSPDSKSGKHLLAHELTHTVQQDGARRAPSIQRQTPAGGGSGGSAGGGGGTGGGGGAGGGAGGGTAPNPDVINVPKFKEAHATEGGITIPSQVPYNENYSRKTASQQTAAAGGGSTDQGDIWDVAVKPKVADYVKTMVAGAAQSASETDQKDPNKAPVYFLMHSGGQSSGKGATALIGTEKTITDSALRPFWNNKGLASAYDVDHVRELQLGGENIKENMELLNFSANRSSGSLIRAEIERKVDLRKAAGTPLTNPFDLKYDDAALGFGRQAFAADYWTRKQIESGEHLKEFKPITDPNTIAELSGKKTPIIYTTEAGGRGLTEAELNNIPNISGAKYTPKPGMDQELPTKGSLGMTITVPGDKEPKQLPNIPVYEMPGVISGGYIPRKRKGKGGLEKILSKLQIVGLSPADVDNVELDPKKGFVITGVIHPSLDIVKGVDLDFFVSGDELGISKTIVAGDIKAPPPLKITDAFLTIGVSTKGAFVEGTASFGITGLGTGSITGKGKSNGDFGIDGKFNFDKKLFKGDASITVGYNNKDGWSLGGSLQLSDKIKGIKEGSINVTYANNVLTAVGTAKTTIKGIKDVTLRITMGPDSSTFEGDVNIDKLPGIKSGEGHLKIEKIGDIYSFSGSGKILPDIPKLTTQIDFSFHDDIFTVDASLDYVNDRLSGKLKVGITNQDVDDDGKPTGKGKGEFTVYGGGQLTLKITDNVTATAGVKLLKNGEIEVDGEISLGQKFEVVPTLLDIKDKDIIPFPTIHIPLFGIPLGVATIGLEATITPKLTASVQLGPGSLTNVGAKVKYNPSHPDDMTVTGQADFEFIAEAGITAGVDFGIAVSAGIASLTGGINLSAYIKAAAEQPVFHTEIKYSPKTGFELSGDVKALIKAILGFSGKLFLQAEAGVSIFKVSKRWDFELFRKEIDTGLDIGFEFPFSYKDGKGNAGFENLKFTYPKFDDNFMDKIKAQFVTPVKEKLTGDIKTDEKIDQ